MRFESRKRRFYEEVEKEFKQRVRDIFSLIGEDRIPNFSYIVTWEIVRDNLHLPWDWDGLSYNPSVATWEIVRDNPDKPWDWDGLSENSNITWEIVKNNSNKPWKWWGISENPNITWEIVKDNLDKPWSWRGLRNTLYQKIVNKHGREHMAAFIIQNRWRNISVDPYHPLGEKVIMGRIPDKYRD